MTPIEEGYIFPKESPAENFARLQLEGGITLLQGGKQKFAAQEGGRLEGYKLQYIAGLMYNRWDGSENRGTWSLDLSELVGNNLADIKKKEADNHWLKSFGASVDCNGKSVIVRTGADWKEGWKHNVEVVVRNAENLTTYERGIIAALLLIPQSLTERLVNEKRPLVTLKSTFPDLRGRKEVLETGGAFWFGSVLWAVDSLVSEENIDDFRYSKEFIMILGN